MVEAKDIPEETVKQLREANRVAVLTGAGVSAESGIPTFRGESGLWKEFRGEDLATPQAFSRDPDLVWEWYHWRRGIVQAADPNPAHEAIVVIEKMAPEFSLITQNVDGLHREAGSENILEIHGNLNRGRCTSCNFEMFLSDETGIPKCKECSSVLRPDVVWFGENLDMRLLEESYVRASQADMFIVAGTSNLVQPAASLAYASRNQGGYVLEVNLDPTPLTGDADETLLGKAGEVLPSLVDLVWNV